MTDSTQPGFFIVPFAFDGEQVGSGYWPLSRLSAKWLGVCSEFIQAHGPVFDAPWSGKLSHIRTKFTSASGAAIGTFFVQSEIVSSVLLLNGSSPNAEQTVAKMFADSLTKTFQSQLRQPPTDSFSKISSISERPLMVIVHLPAPDVSDDDQEIVRELALHLAGAFFARCVAAKSGR